MPLRSKSPIIHCRFAATKMFVSNLNARLAQRFLALVLLPRIRRDIAEHKRLHFALFQALKKATYKPGAFYKVRLHCTASYCIAWSCGGLTEFTICLPGPPPSLPPPSP
jgi:hypothetical protein